MDDICRLCASKSEQLIPIFSINSDGRIICDLITLLIPIKIKMDDDLPNNICKKCMKTINDMHSLRNNCMKNDIELINVQKVTVKCEVLFESPTESSGFYRSDQENDKGDDEDIPDKDECSSNSDEETRDDKGEWWNAEKKTKESKDYSCTLCDLTFKFSTHLTRHYKKQHKNASSKLKYNIKAAICPICGLFISQSSNLKRHMLQYHDESLRFACPKCPYRFAHVGSLRNHGMKFHNQDDLKPNEEEDSNTVAVIYICDLCGAKKLDKRQLKSHLYHKHQRNIAFDDASGRTNPKMQFKCEYCDRMFTNRSNMFRHYQMVHNDELPFQCTICKEGFRLERTHIKHMEKIHQIENNKIPNPETRHAATEPFICEFCSENCTTSRYQYERHLIIVHETELNEILSCEFCKKKFVFKESFGQHLAWHKRKEDEKNFEHGCDMCPRRFPSIKKLDRHKIHFHVGQSSLVCYICGKKMRNKFSLNFHVKRHSEKREFACPQCPQSFVYVKELDRHMISHDESRRYACTYEGCTKRFNDLYVFQLHKKRHAGLLERKFHCEYCEKKFTSRFALDRHVLIHTQQRPHACEYCPMAYTQRNDLLKHLREHLGDSIYKCDFEGCDQGFRLKTELKQHYAVHYLN